MKKTLRIALLAAITLGSASVYAYRYRVTLSPEVKMSGGGGGNLKYTMKIVLGPFDPKRFALAQGTMSFETAGICMWGSQFLIEGGRYNGEKIDVKHDQTSPNVCSNRSFYVATKEELAGKPNVTVGEKGLLAVQMSNE